MPSYDEKAYRVAKSKEGPSLAEQKSQLARLKQDLEQFKNRQAGATVMASLQERIRELEASVARADTARMLDREARRIPKDQGGDRTSASEVRSTSSRFPPRGTPGRWS
ncbi:MAG TPA: Gas vesicle protein V [Azospirillum sp.]|nr:Gas vesicle protein V [Azospirillum sp.]